MKGRLRRVLPALRRVRRAAGRHYVSAVSAVVLAAAGAVALTSASFELADPAPGDVAQQPGGVGAAVEPSQVAVPNALPALASYVPRARPLTIVYLVEDEEQGKRVVETYSLLRWDHRRPDDFQYPRVHFLVAGTPSEESVAIQSLNYYIEIATQRQFDLQVVDLRAGRIAADGSLP